jgi:DNA-binding NtrC family response regulator
VTEVQGRILVLDEPGDPASLEGEIRRAFPSLDVSATGAGESEWPGVAVRLAAGEIDLVLVEQDLPGRRGLELVADIKAACPSTLVILTAREPSLESAIAAIREVAFDYLAKPVGSIELRDALARAMRRRALGRERRHASEELEHQRAEVNQLRQIVAERLAPESALGSSPAIQPVYRILEEVCRTDSTVLITGESGTGKGMLARMIHANSPRAAAPFVEANCHIFSSGLLQSELFGHEAGAFTGASRLKRGRFEIAQGGTLFLDEVGDLGPEIQVLLLRILQEHRFERVGGEQTLEADVRVIAATNRDLARGMRTGAFRTDLFYRLNVVPIHMPALRERREDIPLLAERFQRRRAAQTGRDVPRFSPEAMDALVRYPWPGNIRELENLVERLVVLTRGERIGPEDLPAPLRGDSAGPAELTLLAQERGLILEVLRRCGGNKKQAARDLGIHRSSLYSKLRRYGITPAETN